MKEKKLLSKWSSFAFGLAVLSLFSAVLVYMFTVSFSASFSILAAAVSLFLLSSVLDWMGEVTRQQAEMISTMQAIRENQEKALNADNHNAAECATAPASAPPTGSAVVDAFIKGTPQSTPGTFDAEQVANIYRRSQHSGE